LYPAPFRYHRVETVKEASRLLRELGEESRVIAGGQSLIPLMKMRLARPADLIDINRIPGLDVISRKNGELRFGALARHADIENSEIAAVIPLLRDCAAGIADVQVRNQGTIGGSLAEADPASDWCAALLALETSVHCVGGAGERVLALPDFLKDAYTTTLAHDELVQEVAVKVPQKNSGGSYVAFKRSAPVYPSASAAVQLTLADKNTCREIRIVIGCVGLTAIRAREAERELSGRALTAENIRAAGEAARGAAEPQGDLRGSADYNRALVAALVRRAIGIAARRARGETVPGGHLYAGR